MRDDFLAYMQRNYECRCCEVIAVKICSSSHDFYVFALHQNPSDNIFDCLLMVIAKVLYVDRKSFFLFVSDMNPHHQEWFGSSTTNLNG